MADDRNLTMPQWQAEYQKHGPAILAFLKSRLKRREEAEDILQETFVRAIKAGDGLRDPGKIRSYLFSTAHNLLVNHVKRRRDILLDPDGDDRERPMEAVIDSDVETPESIVLRHELEEKLGDIMEAMKPAHKKAFELAVIQHKPYNEISRLTGWSASQVKINVYRARKQAIESLQDWMPEGDRGSK